MNFQFGQVFLARFPFTSGASSKARPVLVLFDAGQDVIICRVTSAAPRGPRDVSLQNWQEAGLAQASVARLDRLVTAEKSLLTRKLGDLSAEDLLAVKTAWKSEMQL